MFTEIFPKLWICSKKDLNDNGFIKSRSITCIINCTISNDTKDIDKSIDYLRIPISDNPAISSTTDNELMLSNLPMIVEYIHQKLIINKVVLICCNTGMQRAPSIVAAYLMKYGKVSLKKSITYIQGKRCDTFKPMMNFYVALEKYHDTIK